METVLLVEKDDTQRWLYVKELENEGYNVVSTKTARQALGIVQSTIPDLIVVDIMVPDMDGSELIGRLISLERKLPIIIHTAHKGFSYRFMSSAAEAFVIKSSDLTELKNRIRENIKMALLKYNYANN